VPTSTVEILACFGDTLLHVKRLRARGPSCYRVGPDPDADLRLELPGAVLVQPGPTGFVVNLPDGQQPIPDTGEIRLTLASVELTVRAPLCRKWRLTSGQRLPARYLGLSLLGHALAVLLILAAPPTILALASGESGRGPDALVHLRSSRSAPPPQHVPLWRAYGDYLRRATGPGLEPSSEVGFHRRHRGRAGQMGSATSRHDRRRIALRGADQRKLARNLAREAATRIAAIGTGHHLASVLGVSDPLGNAARDALGQLQGKTEGEAYGIGGLGVAGAGRGGGGPSDLIGESYGVCGCMDYSPLGSDAYDEPGQFRVGCRAKMVRRPRDQLVMGVHLPRAPSRPTVRLGRGEGQAGADGHAVRAAHAVIRAHADQVRFCYERRQRDRPRLQGQVSLQLDILPAGEVKRARVASSTLDDEPLHRCLLDAARRWRFPRSPRPLVVTYPFFLRLSGS